MNINFSMGYDHFTQLMFWLDTMVGTEFFSITTTVGAVLLYTWLRIKTYGLQRIPKELG